MPWNTFGCEYLIDNRQEIHQAYPEAVCDPISIDDLMVSMWKEMSWHEGINTEGSHNFKSHGKSLLLIFALFLFLGLSSGSPVKGAMMVMQFHTMAASCGLYSHDKLSNWDCYACTMPMKRSEIVIARHFVTIILSLLFLRSPIVKLFIYSGYYAEFQWSLSADTFIQCTFGLIMILISLILVLNYKFGSW